jgi:GxxExxY protein
MASTTIIPTPRVNQVSGVIVNAAMKVHTILGPGTLGELVPSLSSSRTAQSRSVGGTQVGLPVVYEGEKLDCGYRIDLLVENLVIVEIKSVDAIHPIHEAQLLSYLRLSGKNVGLLINFHVVRLKDGITRMVDGKNWEQ